MFVDASAIIAILTGAPEADLFADLLAAAAAPVTSPIAVFEAALGICRTHHASPAEAAADLRAFLDLTGIAVAPVTEQETAVALEAFARYGKGCGHPAQLNLGDCFAYAGARTRRTALLFKGDDFAKTDITPAAMTARQPVAASRPTS